MFNLLLLTNLSFTSMHFNEKKKKMLNLESNINTYCFERIAILLKKKIRVIYCINIFDKN